MSGPMGGGHGRRGGGAPGQKSMNFGPSLKRLLAQMGPEKGRVFFVICIAIIAVVMSVVSPKIMGNATNEIFGGYLSQSVVTPMLEPVIEQQVAAGQLPAGTTTDNFCELYESNDACKQAVIDMFQSAIDNNQLPAGVDAASANDQLQMLNSLTFTPGHGIDYGALGDILLLILMLYVISAVFSWLQGFLLAGVVQRTMYRLRRDIERKINRLPLKYFDGQTRGEVLSRVTNDIDNVGQSLQQSFSQVLQAILTVIGVLVMMLTISWQLSLVAIATIPVAGIIMVFIMKRSQKEFVAQWDWTGKLNSHIEEMHTGHALVQVFGQKQAAKDTFQVRNDRVYNSSFKAQFISMLIQPAMTFVTNLNYVVIAVVGGLKVASGSMSLGDVQAFIQYSRQFTQPITQIASQMNQLQSGVASAERVFELLDEPEESSDPTNPVVLDSISGRVEFEDVTFSYSPDKPLIENLDLWAKPGQTVAIVGHTGAGKTTLVNLLMRFYEVDGGRITLDGVDTATMTRDFLRSKFGMVLQDTWLFEGTIRDNIAYGSVEGATEEQIMQAAEATYVDRFVRHLPDGYDTIIDAEGSNISAGQKQLLTIARAFLSDPAILILDEATSSVDTRTEVLIQRAMNKLREGRTSFVIAHRLSTIRDADVIVVMDEGKIVEKGNHEELISERGTYFDLYNSQFEAPVEDLTA